MFARMLLCVSSCVKYVPTAATWAVANSSCRGMDAAVHLLTTRQVGATVARPMPLVTLLRCCASYGAAHERVRSAIGDWLSVHAAAHRTLNMYAGKRWPGV